MKLPWQIIPTRVGIWTMCFTGCLISYMIRVNMGLIIISMTKIPPTADGTEVDQDTSTGERYPWTNAERGLVVGAYFWLFWISSFFGGTIAERFGMTMSVLIVHVSSGILTLITPLFAGWSVYLVMVIRALLGFGGGIIYPAAHAIIARWAPLHEKGKFISGTVMGTTLGTMLAFSLSGVLIANYGWPMAFYVQGIITLLWCLIWWYIVTDTPDDHTRIGEDELNYIKSNLPNIKKRITVPPYRHILTSIPYICMVQLQFGNFWGLYLFLTSAPIFISRALGFDIQSTGFIGSLPTLARLGMTILFGIIGDYLLSNKIISLKMLRKGFVTFSHLIPGASLILMILFGEDNTTFCIALMTISMGFNGAAALTNLSNHQDLAPNYAGTLYGIANSVSALGGFLAPSMVGVFVDNDYVFEQWVPVFITGGLFYILTGVVFILFGSVLVQPWNDMEAWNEQKAAAAPKSK